MNKRNLCFRQFFQGFYTFLLYSLITTNACAQNGATQGFTLFSPIPSTTTYLISNTGQVIHTWPSLFRPGLASYLDNKGNLVRTINVGSSAPAGAGGGVQKIDWTGNVIWDFRYYKVDEYIQHHDIATLPNGNILMIAWDYRTPSQAIAAGLNPKSIDWNFFLSERIIEVQPTGPTSGKIVWEWNLWDHLVQDWDSSKNNYGNVAAHPELVDINYLTRVKSQSVYDWIHANTVSYNPDLDQIMISGNAIHEIWVIDHSTSTNEAASHKGGRFDRGGDLLYRWGNPETYRAGTANDRKFYGQHDSQWIDPGCPGAGNILVFNNGARRPGNQNWSSVEEIVPPIDKLGRYLLTPGTAFGPKAPIWVYTDPIPTNFFGSKISGAQRLPNGNTLICSGPQGSFFEVNQIKNTVWSYTNNYPRANSSVFKTRRYWRYLWSDVDTLVAAKGGTINLCPQAGSTMANSSVLLLPGITLRDQPRDHSSWEGGTPTPQPGPFHRPVHSFDEHNLFQQFPRPP